MSATQALFESGNVALIEQTIEDAVFDACLAGGEELIVAFENYVKIVESGNEPTDEFETSLNEVFEPFFENAASTYASMLLEYGMPGFLQDGSDKVDARARRQGKYPPKDAPENVQREARRDAATGPTPDGASKKAAGSAMGRSKSWGGKLLRKARIVFRENISRPIRKGLARAKSFVADGYQRGKTAVMSGIAASKRMYGTTKGKVASGYGYAKGKVTSAAAGVKGMFGKKPAAA